jgi:NAD(P)-dependent dehydrogenase (short-subunit alcohol dehydrogenase family)
VRDHELKGRVAAVTGASRGIGSAIARRLAAEGCAVVLVARSAGALASVAGEIGEAGGQARIVPCDLASAEAPDVIVDSCLREFGGLDILVNNAAVLPRARRMETIPREEWDLAVTMNLTAPWALSCRAKAAMAARGRGVVVNVISTAAFYPSVGLAPYNVTKAALAMLTKACALEWARDGIRVVGVAPGKVRTQMVEPILQFYERTHAPVNPQRRVAEPEEVAELVAFVAADTAAYVTGSIIVMDGGELLMSGSPGS